MRPLAIHRQARGPRAFLNSSTQARELRIVLVIGDRAIELGRYIGERPA